MGSNFFRNRMPPKRPMDIIKTEYSNKGKTSRLLFLLPWKMSSKSSHCKTRSFPFCRGKIKFSLQWIRSSVYNLWHIGEKRKTIWGEIKAWNAHTIELEAFLCTKLLSRRESQKGNRTKNIILLASLLEEDFPQRQFGPSFAVCCNQNLALLTPTLHIIFVVCPVSQIWICRTIC